MRSEKTTALDIVRKHPENFTWGTIEEFYDIGRYTIAKAIDRDGETAYHIWVDSEWGDPNKNVGHSAPTLEYAILIAMSFAQTYDRAVKEGAKSISIDTSDAYYAAKVLGLWDEL